MTEDMENTISPHYKVSVLVPVCERHDDIEQLFTRHRNILQKLNLTAEFIFVIDGSFPEAEKALKKIKTDHRDLVRIITLNRAYGEAKALSVAFAESSAELILTLPSYFQVQPDEITKLFKEFGPDVDLIVGCRYPRRDNLLNRIQARIFHGLINSLTKEPLHDISCGVKLCRRQVLEKINIYGDLHRFLPLLALTKGFRIRELPLQQAQEDIHLRLYRPGVYIRRMLDILTLFFLIKFTQKPLRFFGLLGTGIGMIGLLITLVTVFQRFAYGSALADRPLFLGGILFILVGLQTFFIGLVAEIIIFTHQPEEPQYHIEESI